MGIQIDSNGNVWVLNDVTGRYETSNLNQHEKSGPCKADIISFVEFREKRKLNLYKRKSRYTLTLTRNNF